MLYKNELSVDLFVLWNITGLIQNDEKVFIDIKRKKECYLINHLIKEKLYITYILLQNSGCIVSFAIINNKRRAEGYQNNKITINPNHALSPCISLYLSCTYLQSCTHPHMHICTYITTITCTYVKKIQRGLDCLDKKALRPCFSY